MTVGKNSMTWGSAVAMALIGALPSGAAAQRGRAELNDGNRLYEEGRFPEAHEKYLEALRNAPDLPLALFNDGNALYESEEYVRALDAYLGAIESGDPALAAPAWYNLGNALYRQQRFEESAEAYKEALRIDPGQIDYSTTSSWRSSSRLLSPKTGMTASRTRTRARMKRIRTGSRTGSRRIKSRIPMRIGIKVRSPKNLRRKIRPSLASSPSRSWAR